MRICIVYDCLFPHTIGGAERWYRNLAEHLAADGNEVTYLTLRQWERDENPEVAGTRVVAVGPRLALYTESGRRKIGPPLVFGAGVLWHLLRQGQRYDVVHTASFPYFSLLAAALVRPLHRFGVVVDWHEIWSRAYWREYLGGFGGRVGAAVQGACLRVPQRAFCFAHRTAERLKAEGLRGPVTVLEGEWAGTHQPGEPQTADPVVTFAGRHIPEKQPAALVAAVGRARESLPELTAFIFGDGPDRGRVLEAIDDHGLRGVVSAPGFVDKDEVESTLRRSLCLVLPSRREGYGLIVVEAASYGVPSIVVEGEDNAAVELIESNTNGFVVASASAADLAEGIRAVERAGPALRASTAAWFEANAPRLSLTSSLDTVGRAYLDQAESSARR